MTNSQSSRLEQARRAAYRVYVWFIPGTLLLMAAFALLPNSVGPFFPLVLVGSLCLLWIWGSFQWSVFALLVSKEHGGESGEELLKPDRGVGFKGLTSLKVTYDRLLIIILFGIAIFANGFNASFDPTVLQNPYVASQFAFPLSLLLISTLRTRNDKRTIAKCIA